MKPEKINIAEIKQKAEKGDSEAQFRLGEMYEYGRGVEGDDKEAFNWYLRAARQGHVNAKNAYYELLNSYRRIAAEKNYDAIDAQNMLGEMYEKGELVDMDYEEAYLCYIRAAEMGDARAQYNLGRIYCSGEEFGPDGIGDPKSRAAEWYLRAAEQDEADAQYCLAQMYERGEGVEEDLAEALNWYRRAAELGHASAQYEIGAMYAEGYGVAKDEAESKKWLKLSAEQGNSSAKERLAGWL